MGISGVANLLKRVGTGAIPFIKWKTVDGFAGVEFLVLDVTPANAWCLEESGYERDFGSVLATE